MLFEKQKNIFKFTKKKKKKQMSTVWAKGRLGSETGLFRLDHVLPVTDKPDNKPTTEQTKSKVISIENYSIKRNRLVGFKDKLRSRSNSGAYDTQIAVALTDYDLAAHDKARKESV